ncbi:unnamed protein product [Spirodela intermedia]|uniref:Uncharacterized protein n=1 Tax=Spirodela intermedia TaxID=51605 RepID=A0A7I8IPT5_SPIIN|nr:unnamed protein product [Spirodela intermedia]CAA6659011.1 unnamed protein product [Spirodela intermedia]
MPIVPGRRPGGWKTMPYIIGNETFERVASFGMTTNLTVYLVKRYNMGAVAAANLTNIWNGTTNFAPLVGAFLSDAYWGRFPTIVLACVATFLGMVGMTLTASVSELRPPSCDAGAAEPAKGVGCVGPTAAQSAMLVASLSLLTVGAGGVRPCNLPFGADQFDRTTKEGRRGTNSFFNWYYTTNTAAVMVGLTFVVYLQDSVSWAVGMAVPAGLMLLSLALFLFGAGLYVYVPPEGSVLAGVVQVFAAAYRKRSLPLPSPPEQEATLFNPPAKTTGTALPVVRLPLSQQFRVLNRAAIKLPGEVKCTGGDEEGGGGAAVNRWRLCSVQQIEEVKCLIRIVPVWVSGITCFLALSQLWTFAVIQAFFMDRRLGSKFQVPPASLGVVSLLSIVVFLPIYDRLLVPLMRRATKQESGITLLQRMGIGNFISLSPRRHRAVAEPTRPLSVMWLVPQLALVGLAEAFNAVGQMEFYNQQFPEQMRSIATSLFYCSIAGANYLSSLVVEVVQRKTGKHGQPNWLDDNINAGRLEYFYYLLAGMGFANLLYFLVCAHFYRYKGSGSSVAPGAGEQELSPVYPGDSRRRG